MNENFSDIVAKKETELKKEVVKQEDVQKKMEGIQRKVDTSPLDQAHKDKVKQELGKLHDGHKSRLQGLEKTTEASLKSAVENIQKDLETFESRPEVAFLFQVINAPEFKEIQKQQESIPVLEAKVAAAAREYQSHLMANGELAPGHETKIEEYVMSINELYIGMGALVQQKESFAGSNPEHLQVLEKVLGKKNTITLANFKANPAVHGGVEASSSELKIPATSAELKNLQRIAANNLLQVRSALYRSTGNPKYEEAYRQESEMIRQGLASQANTPLEAVSTTPENETMKRHAQEKLTSVGAEFAAIQNARGKDPISAQRDAVTLLERLRGFTKGYKMGDADKDLQMVELKKFPEVEKAFQDGVEKYIGETENLILDATTNNPTMRTYQTEAMSVTEGTLPFIKSVETLFQQVQNGQGVPSENTMKMFHDNANGILLDPGFNKLASTDAYQFFGNLKIPDEAASPRLHEIMTKMQEAQQKVKDYIHAVNVVTRQVLGMQGHGVGPEAFFKDAAKFTAITVAAVAGAVAMGALVAASGGALTGVAFFAANTVATSLGAAIGSNYMTAAIEGNTDAISTENMAAAWGQGMLFSGAGGLVGQALGSALGKGAQQLSQTFNIAPGKILSVPSIKEGIRATGLKGYLQQVASETKEEMVEDVMQRIGEGLAPNEPWLGFVFSLIPSASGKARDILHQKSTQPSGIKSTVTDAGIDITYTDQAEAIQALEQAHAPAELIEAVQSNQSAVFERDGISVTVRPANRGNEATETTPAREAAPINNALINTNVTLDFGNANTNMAEAQAKITQKAIELIEKGEKPTTRFEEDVKYLKQTDPETYELLRKSDLESLARTECLSAMLAGRKETMTDMNGKKIIFYRGKELGKGGVGLVANVAYQVEGEAGLKFAAIKRPLDPKSDTFKEEMEAGKIVQSWEGDHIMKPLHLSESLIIYESGREATDFLKMYTDPDIKGAEYFAGLHEMGKGLQEYQKRGMFHGDIKFANVMSFDGKVKIIDNTPVAYAGLENRIITDWNGKTWIDWPHTDHFSVKGESLRQTRDVLMKKRLSISQINSHLGRAIDAISYGKMIQESLNKFSPDWRSNQEVSDLMDTLSDPLTAGEPGMLERAMAFVDQMAQTNGVASGITIAPAPTFIPQQVAEESVSVILPRPGRR